ncbi:MAG: hypothetical protein K2H01_03140 [Ruminococcus sp.]|nr:hypothetical protein [Ruminococcus sp.]
MKRPTNKPKAPPFSRRVWAEVKKNMYLKHMDYIDLVPLLGFSDTQPLKLREKDPDKVSLYEVEQIFRAMGLRIEIHIEHETT